MITIATLLWRPNADSFDFSRSYDETWVERLYRGCARNLTQPFRFVCYTDREYAFKEPIVQHRIKAERPSYADCLQPYEMGAAMILMGLDTVITGNIDHLAAYCLDGNTFALPRDPYHPHQACNGVALVPEGREAIWKTARRGDNDMEHVRKFPHVFIDDIFPGEVKSYKGHVKQNGLGGVKVCYFHGQEKPHQLSGVPWIAEHWI